MAPQTYDLDLPFFPEYASEGLLVAKHIPDFTTPPRVTIGGPSAIADQTDCIPTSAMKTGVRPLESGYLICVETARFHPQWRAAESIESMMELDLLAQPGV